MHAVINQLRLDGYLDPEAISELNDLVIPAALATAGFRGMHLISVGEGHYIVVVLGDDAAVLEQINRDLGTQWLQRHCAPRQTRPAERVVGAVVAGTDRVVTVDLDTLVADLRDQTLVFEGLLARLADDPAWDIATPAEGWAVRDQVGHVAYFDEAATTSANDRERFLAEREVAFADVFAWNRSIGDRTHTGPPSATLRWFRDARAALIDTFSELDPALRVPWYGPDMSAASALTARIMETWAHGQDIADALGVAHDSPVSTLRHVAHLGARTLPNSFRARGLDVPDTAVGVVLSGPEGDEWRWGDGTEGECVCGPALDFCLVVTQRRHLADTAVETSGAVAAQWMSIAQAFAGPPGSGRRPGEFVSNFEERGGRN